MITLHIFVNTKYYNSQYFKCVQLNQRGKPALGETQRVHFRKKSLALFCQQRAAVSKVEHDCNSRPSFTFTTQMHLSVHFAPTFRTTYNYTAEFSNRPYPVAMFVKSYLHLCSHSSQTELLNYITH